MGRYIVKRLLYALLVMLIASMIAFFLIRLAPGDPARLLLGDAATDEQVALLREQMGLNKPLVIQYGIFLRNILHGDFGQSTAYGRNCLELIATRLPKTVSLAVAATIMSLLISIPMGLRAATHKGSFSDFFSVLFALLGQSMAPVWVGIILILIFGVTLRWLPTQGSGSLLHLILPAFTLGFSMSGSITRQLRSSMYAVLQEDYITATYARGVSKHKVNSKYALKNALMPVITVVGTQFAHMLSGSVVIENVFGLPGLGSLLLKSINTRDYALTQSILLVSCAIFVVSNLLIDFAYAYVDPRVQLE